MNQCLLARECNLLKEQSSAAVKEADILNTEFLELEQTSKRRVLYLELWKKGALERMHRLQAELKMSVPQQRMQNVMNRLEAVSGHYCTVLHREAEVRAAWATCRNMPRQISGLKLEVELGQGKIAKAEDQVAQALAEAAFVKKVSIFQYFSLQWFLYTYIYIYIYIYIYVY